MYWVIGYFRRYVTERLLNTKVVKGEYRAKFIWTLLSRIHNLTQEELSLKSGLGLRFVRDLEQGKETLRLDKVNQLLDFFNYEMVATSKIDNQWDKPIYFTKTNWQVSWQKIVEGAACEDSHKNYKTVIYTMLWIY